MGAAGVPNGAAAPHTLPGDRDGRPYGRRGRSGYAVGATGAIGATAPQKETAGICGCFFFMRVFYLYISIALGIDSFIYDVSVSTPADLAISRNDANFVSKSLSSDAMNIGTSWLS